MTDVVPLAFTFVQYERGDLLGKMLACASLMPYIVLITFATLIVSRRDLRTITFFIGLVCNESINMILKRIIRQPRPYKLSSNYNEWGMPSAHAQFMAFLTAYMSMFLWMHIRWEIRGLRAAVIAVFINLTAIVSFSRVYLGYHTIDQVEVGCIVGIIIAILWFVITEKRLVYLFPSFTKYKLCKMLMIRDCTHVDNILLFEYEKTVESVSEAACNSKSQ